MEHTYRSGGVMNHVNARIPYLVYVTTAAHRTARALLLAKSVSARGTNITVLPLNQDGLVGSPVVAQPFAINYKFRDTHTGIKCR